MYWILLYLPYCFHHCTLFIHISVISSHFLLCCRSLIKLQGKSVDYAKHAIPSELKRRIILTFGKSQPKKSISQSPSWFPPANRSSYFPRHSSGIKHYGHVPTTGVLQASPALPQHMHTTNGMQPLINGAGLVANTMPYSLSHTSSAWTVPIPPRHPLPGTGVFLPPPDSSHQPSSNQQSQFSETSCMVSRQSSEVSNSSPYGENEEDKSNIDSNNSSPKDTSDATSQKEKCSGIPISSDLADSKNLNMKD